MWKLRETMGKQNTGGETTQRRPTETRRRKNTDEQQLTNEPKMVGTNQTLKAKKRGRRCDFVVVMSRCDFFGFLGSENGHKSYQKGGFNPFSSNFEIVCTFFKTRAPL